MAYAGLTVDYMVNKATDPIFVPGNCQAPTNSHDNPDNGTAAQRAVSNVLTSPDAVEVVAA